MAVDRFYRPGQSTYQSQYVPLKLPFELMQNNLAKDDAKMNSLMQQNKALGNDIQTAGIDRTKLDSYFGSVGGVSFNGGGEIILGDRSKSQKSANEISNFVSELSSDDLILSASSGELADRIIQGSQMLQEHNAKNQLYSKREEAIKDIQKTIVDKKGEWGADRTLILGLQQELDEAAKDPNYVPTNVGVGKYFNSQDYMLNKVNMLKDESYKSLGEDGNFNTWSKTWGVKADRYSDFVYSLMKDDNGPLKQEADRKINALIKSGVLEGEEEINKAYANIVQQHVATARNLEHRSSDKGKNFKSEGQLEAENTSAVQTMMEADAEFKPANSLSFNEGVQKGKEFAQNVQISEEYLKNKLPEGVTLKMFREAPKEKLQEWGLTNIGGANIIDFRDRYNSSFNELAHQNALLEYNENIARDRTGFVITEENKIKTLDYIKSNPQIANNSLATIKQYEQAIIYGDQNALQNLNNLAKADPNLKTLLDLRENAPEFYNELLNKSESGELNKELIIQNTTSNSFIGNDIDRGSGKEYKPSKAKEFFNSIGGVPEGVDVYNQASVNKWLKLNKESSILTTDYNEASMLKDRYNYALGETTLTYQPGIITYPGQVIGLTDQEVNQLDQFTDYGQITLLDNNGNPSVNYSGDARILKSKVMEDMRKRQGGANLLRLNDNTWKVTSSATIEELYNGDMKAIEDKFNSENEGTFEALTKEERAAYLKRELSYTMELESNSPTFNKAIDNKVTTANTNKAVNGTITPDDVFPEVIANNYSQAKELENELGNVAYSKGANGKGAYVSTTTKNIQLVVPQYINGQGKNGDMTYTIKRIEPAVNDDGSRAIGPDGKLAYSFFFVDGLNREYPAISATSANDFISTLSGVGVSE